MILGSPHVEAVGKERMRLFLGMISHGVSTCKKSSVAAEPVDEVAMNIALRYKPGVKDTATGKLTPRSCKKCELTPHLGKFTQYKILINL